MWVDYSYYATAWADTQIPAQEFLPIATKAQRFVNYITGGKICNDKISDKVKNAVCAAADALYTCQCEQKNYKPGIKSESVDNVSVSYTDYSIKDHDKLQQDMMYRAASIELAGTGLLYRGC